MYTSFGLSSTVAADGVEPRVTEKLDAIVIDNLLIDRPHSSAYKHFNLLELSSSGSELPVAKNLSAIFFTSNTSIKHNTSVAVDVSFRPSTTIQLSTSVAIHGVETRVTEKLDASLLDTLLIDALDLEQTFRYGGHNWSETQVVESRLVSRGVTDEAHRG